MSEQSTETSTSTTGTEQQGNQSQADNSQQTETERTAAEQQRVEELPEWARASLEKANKEAAKFRAQVRELQPKAGKYDELEAAKKSEQQRLTEAQLAAEQRAQEAETKLLRHDVAASKGLDPRYVGYVTGSTQEEVEASVEKVKTDFGATSRTASADQGVRTTSTGPKNMNDFLREQMKPR